MIGAIAGDMIGSPYEGAPVKRKDFDLRVACFTDDTVLSLAVAKALMDGTDYGREIRAMARRYPHLPYGGSFYRWVWQEEEAPYGSFGNGSAMRVSPVGFAVDTVEAVLTEAGRCAAVTHNHPEGIRGAQSVALAIFLARQGHDKADIRSAIEGQFGYDLSRTVDAIRPGYRFDVTCQGSVPESIIAFLESVSWEDAVRTAVSLGGDADTMACIAGGIAQAYYRDVPEAIATAVRRGLPPYLLEILDRFNRRYGVIS